MPRLYRPHIPLDVRCRVAMRQLGGFDIDRKIELEHPGAGGIGYTKLLAMLLMELADLFGSCALVDLRLDHNPALGVRQKRRRGKITVYTPDANDPDFLIYRDKHAHHIKTNVRGDGAQYSDTVLMKRERRRKRKKTKRKAKHMSRPILARRNPWPSRPFRSM